MTDNHSNRLDRIEAMLEDLTTSLVEVKNLENSNAQAIQALVNLSNEILPRVDNMQRQFIDRQRQFNSTQHRIDRTEVGTSPVVYDGFV